MSTPYLVEEFYSRIWNQGNVSAASEILTEDFEFRGSFGSELRGVDAFKHYEESVRISLAGYRCEILDCVAEGGARLCKDAVLGLSRRDVSRLRTHKQASFLDGSGSLRLRERSN